MKFWMKSTCLSLIYVNRCKEITESFSEESNATNPISLEKAQQFFQGVQNVNVLANWTHAGSSAIDEVTHIDNVAEFLDILNSSMRDDQEPTRHEIARCELQSRYDSGKESEREGYSIGPLLPIHLFGSFLSKCSLSSKE